MSFYSSGAWAGAAASRARTLLLVVPFLLLFAPGCAFAAEFDASVAPNGRYLLKLYPKIFYTSAFFNNKGTAKNLSEVTGLLYAELPVQLQYGVTGSLSIGAILPLGWSYREAGTITGITDRFAVREVWLTVQHRWLPLAIVSSSSLRVKIPLAKKKDFEDGLRIGDGQVDVYPVYYFDYYSKSHFWFTENTIGYRYRFESDGIKPLDEFNFRSQIGYELLPEFRLRLFLFTDLTQFRNGRFRGGEPKFFQRDGTLHAFGYGITLWPRPTLRLEMATGGDWGGRNQYRGMHFLLGIAKIH